MTIRAPKTFDVGAKAIKEEEKVYVNFMNALNFHEQFARWVPIGKIRPWNHEAAYSMIKIGSENTARTVGFYLSLEMVKRSKALSHDPVFYAGTNLLKEYGKKAIANSDMVS